MPILSHLLNCSVQVINPNDEFWKSMSGNAIGSLVGAIVGGLFAFAVSIFIYWIGKRDETKKKIQEENKIRDSRLFYFSNLVSNVIDASKRQATALSSYINEIEVKKIIEHEIASVPLFDFKRICESDDLENYMLAYSSKFGYTEEVANQVKLIIGSADYLYLECEAIPKEVFEMKTFDIERKKIVLSYFKAIMPAIRNFSAKDYINSQAFLHKDLCFSLRELLTNRDAKGEMTRQADMMELFKDIFQPLSILLFDYQKEFGNAPELEPIKDDINKGFLLLTEIISRNENQANEYKQRLESFITTLNTLSTNSTQLSSAKYF